MKYLDLAAGAVMAIAALALVTSAQAHLPASRCSLKRPEACRDTNQLAWSSSFKSAVQRFVGPGQGPENAVQSAGEAVTLALSGPPGASAQISGGNWLFSACEAHDCTIKGVLLLGSDHRIRGAGVFNFKCDGAGCTDLPRLDLFLRDPHDAEAREILTRWANTTITTDLGQFPTTAAKRLSGVRVLQAALR